MKKKYVNQIHTDVSFKPKDIIGLMTDYFKMKTKLRPIKTYCFYQIKTISL